MIPEFGPNQPVTIEALNRLVRAINALSLRGSELIAVESGPFGMTVRLLEDRLRDRLPKPQEIPRPPGWWYCPDLCSPLVIDDYGRVVGWYYYEGETRTWFSPWGYDDPGVGGTSDGYGEL